MNTYKRPSVRGALVGAFFVLALAGCGGETGNSQNRAANQAGAAKEELAVLTAGLPEKLRDRILAQEEDFTALLRQALKEAGTAQPSLLVLVDKGHALPAGYEPQDLVALEGMTPLGRQGLTLREPAARALAEMSAAAAREGIRLVTSSAYRSFDYQKTVYERNVREMGLAAADRESARPGHSQHQLGTAVDFGSIDDSFARTAASGWLAENAWRFGFSLSYPEGLEELTGYRHESWHYRFIGRAGARLAREYFADVQQLLLEFLTREDQGIKKLLARQPSTGRS